jgi:hypothetical protein
MARLIIIAGLLLLAVSGVFAQEAVIRELLGTVELKPAGSPTWERAVQGQGIAESTVISTGFKSHALIGIGDSIINVRPLTRLSLTEIRASQNTETINVNLQAGRVRLDVNPPAGSRASFSIQTPMATASVRGTVFEAGLFELWVAEGSVEYRGSSGSHIVVDAGGYSTVSESTGRVGSTKGVLLDSLSPVQPIAFDSFNSFSGAAKHKNEIEVGGEMKFD